MAEPADFAVLLKKVRSGDDQAAADLVRQFEPLVRREVRLRLEDQSLSRTLESMDICQSVMGSFFFRAAAGQYDLEHPAQLVRLLTTMARNKLMSQAREQLAQKRDQRRQIADGAEALQQVAGGESTPSVVVAGRELLQRLHEELNPEERQLVELRQQGMGWNEIASRLGGEPNTRRMQHQRALQRASAKLGLEDLADE